MTSVKNFRLPIQVIAVLFFGVGMNTSQIYAQTNNSLQKAGQPVNAGTNAAPPAQPKAVIEPSEANTFYLLDEGANRLIRLEKQTVEVKNKSKAFGLAGAETSIEMAGEKSNVRFEHEQRLQFIVRVADSSVDPDKLIQIARFQSKKGVRRLVITRSQGLLTAPSQNENLNQTAATAAAVPPIKITKYGKTSFLIEPSEPLPAGEYAISLQTSNEGFCFGIGAGGEVIWNAGGEAPTQLPSETVNQPAANSSNAASEANSSIERNGVGKITVKTDDFTQKRTVIMSEFQFAPDFTIELESTIDDDAYKNKGARQDLSLSDPLWQRSQMARHTTSVTITLTRTKKAAEPDRYSDLKTELNFMADAVRIRGNEARSERSLISGARRDREIVKTAIMLDRVVQLANGKRVQMKLGDDQFVLDTAVLNKLREFVRACDR